MSILEWCGYEVPKGSVLVNDPDHRAPDRLRTAIDPPKRFMIRVQTASTSSSAIYSVAMFLLSLPGEDVTGLDGDLMAEVGDLGSLVVNIGLSIRPDTTETWKVRDILEDEVFPWVNFHLNRLQNQGCSPIILELDD